MEVEHVVVNVELLTEVQGARDVGDVVKAITRLAKPFGEIRGWRFFRDREARRLQVYVTLEKPESHAALAGRLGGTALAGEVCFAIPLYINFDTTSPLVPIHLPEQHDPAPASKSKSA